MITDLDVEAPDPASMRKVLGHFCTGVAVITGHDGDRPLGFACQSITSVSLQPPYVSFCPAASSSSWPPIQRDVCARFAVSGGDKFAGVGWSFGSNGAPLLAGVIAAIEADIEFEHPAGDHSIVVAHVTGLRAYRGRRRPLLFYRGDYGGLA